MKFYLGLKENVLFVRYLEEIEEFINNKEVEWNEEQREEKVLLRVLKRELVRGISAIVSGFLFISLCKWLVMILYNFIIFGG